MSTNTDFYTPAKSRRNQVNLHITDEELQTLMRLALQANKPVGTVAREMLRAEIAKVNGAKP